MKEFSPKQVVYDRNGQMWQVFQQQGDLVLAFQDNPSKVGVIWANNLSNRKEDFDEKTHEFDFTNEPPTAA